MGEIRQNQPALIVLTGRPGSGKTTLAHALAKTIRCPAICRDEIKEGFVNTTAQVGAPGDEITWQIYEAFFDTVRLLLDRRITLVPEAAFQHTPWTRKLEAISQIARVRIIVCSLEPQLARKRHIERGLADPVREQFHHDRAVQAAREGLELPIGDYQPPKMDVPTLMVDTSDGYRPDFQSIVSFACARDSAGR